MRHTTQSVGQNTLIKGRLSPANWAARWRTLLVVCWLQVHRVLNVKRFTLYCALKYTKLPSRAGNPASGLTHKRAEFQTSAVLTLKAFVLVLLGSLIFTIVINVIVVVIIIRTFVFLIYVERGYMYVPYTNSSTVRVNRPIKQCPRTSKAWQM